MLVEGFLLALAPRMLFGMFCCGRGKVRERMRASVREIGRLCGNSRMNVLVLGSLAVSGIVHVHSRIWIYKLLKENSVITL